MNVSNSSPVDVGPTRPSAVVETASVVVCIPTFRRPQQLARLLRALAKQRGVEAFELLIGNNDDRALASHAELAAPDIPVHRVIQVVPRGVSAVRNAMVADVLARYASLRWIACLDDDQEPEPDWLAALLAAGVRHDADLVGGPVTRTAPAETFWSRSAADTSYLPMRGGVVPMLNEAGNLLLSARFIRSLERPPFSLDFGRTGGEDYEFFLHARSRGARIVWAPEARVDEPLPAERLTFRSFVWRFYAIAAYQARADRAYRGVGYVVRSMAITMAKAPLVTVRAIVRDRSPRLAITALVQYGAMLSGRAAGLAGRRDRRYGG